MPPVTTMKPDHTVILLLIEHFSLSLWVCRLQHLGTLTYIRRMVHFLNVGLISINCLTIVFFVALVTRCKLKKSFIKMSCSICDGYGTFKTPSLSGVTCGEPRQKE